MKETLTEVWLQLRLGSPALTAWLASWLGKIDLQALTQLALTVYALAQVGLVLYRWRNAIVDRKEAERGRTEDS